MKQIVANIYSQNQNTQEEFNKILKLLEAQGYELIYQNYPTNVSIVEEIQNEGE